jgi:hypothetical protein
MDTFRSDFTVLLTRFQQNLDRERYVIIIETSDDEFVFKEHTHLIHIPANLLSLLSALPSETKSMPEIDTYVIVLVLQRFCTLFVGSRSVTKTERSQSKSFADLLPE